LDDSSIRVKVFTVLVEEEVFLVDEIYAKKGGVFINYFCRFDGPLG
jgi:hypothetical protein